MLWVKLGLGAVFGALIGLLVHVLWTPALDGTCTIICHPIRAPIAGALIAVAAILTYRESARHTGRGTIDEPEG